MPYIHYNSEGAGTYTSSHPLVKDISFWGTSSGDIISPMELMCVLKMTDGTEKKFHAEAVIKEGNERLIKEAESFLAELPE